jgi:hypothetical protein
MRTPSTAVISLISVNGLRPGLAVAFHGFDDHEIPLDILTGGAASYPLKQEIE